MVSDLLRAALAYVELGWPVLPLSTGLKVPAISAKMGGRGVHNATTDADIVRGWWARWPSANIGLACGERSGFLVIDIDPRNGGDDSMAVLGARGYVFPDCPTSRTGGGGRHMLFQCDRRIGGSKDRLGPGIDVKSTGGYIVAVPSFVIPGDSRANGHYRWLRSPFDIAPPRLPIWCQTMLAPTPAPPRRDVPRTEIEGKSIRGLLDFLAKSSAGERNKRLYWAACRAAEMAQQHHVSAAGAADQLLATALSLGTPRKEAERTIQSAFDSINGLGT